MLTFACALLLVPMPVAYAQELSVDQLFTNAVHEQQSGDAAAAIRDYRELLRLHPDMVEAQVNLGAVLVDSGQYDEAIALYKAALPSVSNKKAVLMNIARAYYEKRDLTKAREQLVQVHQIYPEDQDVTMRLASVDLEAHAAADAVALLQPLDSANAQNLNLQYLYGWALIASGRPDEGTPRVERVARTTNRADAYLLAGSTYLQYGHPFEARDDLETALKLDPHLPNIYNLVGEARETTEDDRGAEVAFREVLKANPDDFEANLHLGTILYKRRELQDSELYLDHALKLRPDDLNAQYQSAMLKSASGEYDAAVRELEEISRKAPDWLQPHVELAKLYYQLHRPQDGLRERELANKLAARQQK
jgi:tetratricopeptide (TPR) repeat protein